MKPPAPADKYGVTVVGWDAARISLSKGLLRGTIELVDHKHWEWDIRDNGGRLLARGKKNNQNNAVRAAARALWELLR